MNYTRFPFGLLAVLGLVFMSFVIQKSPEVTTHFDLLAVGAGATLSGWAARHLWKKRLREHLAEQYPDKKRMGCCAVIAVLAFATLCAIVLKACGVF